MLANSKTNSTGLNISQMASTGKLIAILVTALICEWIYDNMLA